jgi:hypothetical protein
MYIESKVRIYKTFIRPVMAYGSETRAETTQTQQLLSTTEMTIVWAIQGKTLKDKISNDKLRERSWVQDINQWVDVWRREWDAHVERMEDHRPAKIARDNRPQGIHSQGRPKKRWKEGLNTASSS